MIAALSGRETDRTPLFPCIYIDHACLACGIPFEDALVNPPVGVRSMLGVARLYGCDAVRVLQTPPRSWYETKEVRTDGDTLVQVDRKSGRIEGHFDVQGGGKLIPAQPPAPITTLEQVAAMDWPSADELLSTGSLDPAREVTDQAHEEGLFVVGMAGGQTINAVVSACGGAEEALIALLENPEFAVEIMKNSTAASIELIRAFGRIGVDGIYIGDSYASGSVISPQVYMDLCVPRYKEATDAAHALGLLVYKHCCGNYNPFLHHVKDSGIDGMEGMDPTSGMSVAETRARAGERLCLIGGVSCLSLLNASPEQVYEEARECIRAGGRTGSFVLGSACAVPRASRKENMLALRRAVMAGR